VAEPIRHEAGLVAYPLCGAGSPHPRLTGAIPGDIILQRSLDLAAITCARLQNRRRGGCVARNQFELNHRAVSIATAPNEKRSNRDDAQGASKSRQAALRFAQTTRHEIVEFVRLCSRERRRTNQTNNQKTEMLQRARAALPLTKIREWAFEGAFFSVALIAMAGWVYFITLLLVRLFLWFFG
jgi:hypothetical protein